MVSSYDKFKVFCEENNLPPEKEAELILIAAAIVREENERTYELFVYLVEKRRNDQQQYRVVGVHGAPTPETAPHGVMYRKPLDVWRVMEPPGVWINIWEPQTKWYPLPPPPTEQAPAPEPVKRWDVRW